jgi:hypothetical protein
MSIFEDKIRKNKKSFDAFEPDEGHFDRFQQKLNELHPEEKSIKFLDFKNILKIAAAILIFACASIVLMIITDNNSSNENIGFAENPNGLSAELDEMKVYYASMADKKMNLIDKLIETDTLSIEFKEIAEREVEMINKENQELQTEFQSNQNDKRLFGAILNNFKVISSVLDKIINQMYDTNSKQSNNNKKTSLSWENKYSNMQV